MGAKNFEIYREEGENFRSLMVETCDTYLRVSGQDMGKLVKEILGASEYEFWATVPQDAVLDLAIALIRHHYSGRADAVNEIQKICESFGVDHKSEAWSSHD